MRCDDHKGLHDAYCDATLFPERSELDEHFHEALGDGRLLFQRTEKNAWLPPRSEDPVTLSPDWEWAR